jgi:hypothetical protein
MIRDITAQDQPISPSIQEKTPDLCQTCLAQPTCARVLRLLYARPTTLMTVPDIAASADLAVEAVQSAIGTLSGLGLLRKLNAQDDLTFYGITHDARRLSDVRDFHGWCAEQRRQWDSVRAVLD